MGFFMRYMMAPGRAFRCNLLPFFAYLFHRPNLFIVDKPGNSLAPAKGFPLQSLARFTVSKMRFSAKES